MNTTTLERIPAEKSASVRYLWVAVAGLGAAVLALGAALVQVQTHPRTMLAAETLAAPAEVRATPAPVVAENSASKEAVTKVDPASIASKKIAKVRKTQPVPVAQSLPPPSGAVADVPPPWGAPAPKTVCARCGTVQAVMPLQQEAAPSGLGAIAGAVLGGLVGNQFGGGDGKAVATMAGALGGGWAGNTVEKRMKKETVYQIDVRMDDGSTQRVTQNTPVAVGAHVTVDGGVITP
ncbi:MAG: glycine zipper 2TM domain-containing protein [Rhodoferax sp.]